MNYLEVCTNFMFEEFEMKVILIGMGTSKLERVTALFRNSKNQRNRFAPRYPNFRWQVVKFYVENRDILKKLLNSIYEYEKSKGV